MKPNLIVVATLALASVSSLYAQFSTTASRIQRGSGVPSSGACAAASDVGKVYYRTDAATTNASRYGCSKTGSSTYAWEVAFGGTTAFTVQGTGTKVQLGAGTTTTNDCAKFDANGNIVDAGAACGSGSGGTAAYTTYNSVSGTPTFVVTASTNVQDFKINLTGAVTSSTLTVTNATTGQLVNFHVCQDATGGRTFTWPTNVTNGAAVDPTASACTDQVGVFDGTNVIMTTGGKTDDTPTKIGPGPERAAPGTPASGLAVMWPDSTAHTWLAMSNNSATKYSFVQQAASRTANQFVTHVASTGIPAVAAIAVADLPAAAFATQTDGSTITWALASAASANGTVTLAGNRTLNITGPLNGGSYVLRVVQDGTGSRGLTLGTGCTWKVSGGGAGAITPSTTASSIDVLTFTYDGTNCYANFNKNFN